MEEIATTQAGVDEIDTAAFSEQQWNELFKNRAIWQKLVLRDLNKAPTPKFFSMYSKQQIIDFLSNPAKNEKQLRQAVLYIYAASSHFRRLIQYFVALSDLSYVIEPYDISPEKASIKAVGSNYRKVLKTLSAMSIKTQFPKILTVCLREDVFYGTFREMGDNITIQQLPSDYCQISVIQGNVPNVTFDLTYFDERKHLLPYYSEEVQQKYDLYKDHKISRYVELDSPNSFAVKCNADILQYAVPPFAGILGELYDIDEYKKMELDKTILENYAMLVMRIPMSDEGKWLMDFKKAESFYRNLDAVLPDQIGSVLSPMPVDKISFERTHADDNDTIASAEQNLFTAAGVSSLIFNNPKASAHALLLSIKADQCLTYGIVKGIEDVVNRYIRYQKYGRNFKVNFLDVSCFNRKEAGDAYLKACQYGVPMISYYCASQGLGQAELDCMSFLEGRVLKLHDLFRPLQNSSQMGSALNDNNNDGEAGAPQKDIGDLTDSGEQSREDGDDWG